MRYGMVIDLGRCVGCQACTLGCKAVNGTPPGMMWGRVWLREQGTFPATRRVMLPLQCMHCKNPPCVDVCPTGASYKRPDGIVVVDYDKCMGCGYCRIACPYEARTILEKIEPYFPEFGPTPYEEMMYKKHQAGVAEKCTFCMDRLAQGEEPKCVETCIAYARTFGDLDDPNSEVSRLIVTRRGYQLFPELGTEPSIYYLAPGGLGAPIKLYPIEVT
jgi:Fe-S-cluster-containing dehydrogenase component